MKKLIVVPIEEALLQKALNNINNQFNTPVSNAAMVRMLLGMLGDNQIKLDIEDMKLYSPESFNMGGRPRANVQ